MYKMVDRSAAMGDKERTLTPTTFKRLTLNLDCRRSIVSLALLWGEPNDTVRVDTQLHDLLATRANEVAQH